MLPPVGVRTWIEGWPVYRQLTGTDPLGRGAATQSPRSKSLTPRTADADHVAHSVCPYCAVGCAQKVYVTDDQVVQIEGNPDSPHSRGRLCPKGSASKQLVTGPHREQKVLYRAPYATDWTELELDRDWPASLRMVGPVTATASPISSACPCVSQSW